MPPLTTRCSSAAGIIEAVAKDFFDIDVTLDILGMNTEEERTGKKEHVVFLVVQKSHRQRGRAKPNRLQGNQDVQRDQEVLGLLCLQKAQSLLVGLPGFEQSMQRTEPNGPSHSGFKAEFLNLHTIGLWGQIILCDDRLFCACLAAFLVYPLAARSTLLPTPQLWPSKLPPGINKCPQSRGRGQKNHLSLRTSGLRKLG